MNKCIFIGRLTADPETRDFEWGQMTIFTLAMDRRYKNKDGSKTTDFIDFKATNKMAEIVSKYFKKGDLAYVVSEAQRNKYEKDGEMRYTTQFLANEARVLYNNKKVDRDGSLIEDVAPF